MQVIKPWCRKLRTYRVMGRGTKDTGNMMMCIMNINVKTLKMAYKRWCQHSWLQVVTEPYNKYTARGTEKTVHTVVTSLLCLPLHGLHLLALCHNSCLHLTLKFLAPLHQHVNLKDNTKSSTNQGQSSELWGSVYYKYHLLFHGHEIYSCCPR